MRYEVQCKVLDQLLIFEHILEYLRLKLNFVEYIFSEGVLRLKVLLADSSRTSSSNHDIKCVCLTFISRAQSMKFMRQNKKLEASDNELRAETGRSASLEGR